MAVLTLSIVVLLLDQATKALALTFLSESQSVQIIPGIFHLTLLHNPGVAFGLLRGQSLLILLGTAGILLLLLWTVFRQGHGARWASRISLGLILGGAGGNLIDRIRFGGVVDFLDFRIWPIFNGADSCITVGAIWMAWTIMRGGARRAS